MPPTRDEQAKPETRRVRILSDAHAWNEPTGNPLKPFEHRVHFRGDEVELPLAEIERAEMLDREHPLWHGKRLGTDDDLAERERSAERSTPLEPERLSGMTLEEVHAYLTQNPEQAQNVADAEAASLNPREPVVDLAENVAAEYDVAQAAAAEERARAEAGA
jgi:hypothetical protein